jgi:hypothetical protein
MANDGPAQGTLSFQAHTEGLELEAKRALAAAETLALRDDPNAGTAFDDAESLADRAAAPELQMRAHRGHAEFLAKSGAFRQAREHFLTAEQTALFLDMDESVAHLQVRIAEMEINLVGDKGRKTFFENFRKAARGAYTWQDRRDVWFRFVDDLNTSGGRLAARKFGSEGDFRSRLDAAR